jgi:hypothetical protein
MVGGKCREIAGGTYHMDSVKEVFRAAAAALEPLLSNSNGGLPGKAGAGSILEQLFPVRKALSRVPLPVDLPAPLPNPLKGPSLQPDRNAGRLPSAGKASRKSPAGQSYMPHLTCKALDDASQDACSEE